MRAMKEVWTPLKLFGIRYYKERDRNVYYKKVRNNSRVETKPFWKYKSFVLVMTLLLLAIPGGYAGYQIVLDQASDKLVNEVAGQVTKEDMNKLLQDPSVQQVLEKELGTKKASELLQKNNIAPSAIATARITSDDLTFGQNAAANKAVLTKGQEQGKEESNNQEESKPETAGQQENKEAAEGPSATQPGNTTSSTDAASGGKEQQPKLAFKSRQEATQFVMGKFSMSEISDFAKAAQGGLTEEEKNEIKSKVTSRLTAEEYEALKLFGIIELSKQQ
ncbi:hypothetical protein ACFOU2_07605 [Bacillus songklensis]|uniref:Uncharacterized protein n=1 Tax=Bacillus songklensis TaxID=1069116 RepID=A0ABV8B2I2_9BACI